jgi:CheY-like chemotaxis protein
MIRRIKMRNSKPILIIEDDRIDAMTLRRALEELGGENRLINATDCEQALEYLRNQENEMPCLIITDINTPKMNGMEFLRTVKAEELFKDIPVVIMSASDRQQDREQASQLGAVRYIDKSADYAEFVEELGAIKHLWTSAEVPAATQSYGPPIPY